MLGKINASLSKKLKDVEWGEYRLEKLFEIIGTKSLDSNAIEFTKTGINFVGRTFENNGIQGKIQKRKFEPNEPFSITATVIGNYKYVKYQKEPYYCSQNINRLTPRPIISKWNEQIAYFFVTNIQKFVSGYDNQQGGYKLKDIKKHKIKIPLKNNKIDFDFIEKFMVILEKKYIIKLSDYINSKDLQECELTGEDRSIINQLNTVKTKEIDIEEIFDVKSSKKKFNANTIKFNGEYPYVARGSSNNGIKGYISENVKYLNEEKTISFGQDTATVFYQNKPYFTGDKIKIMKLRNRELTEDLALYLITTMKKSFQTFAWGQSSFGEKILKSVKIEVPVKRNKIDYEFMKKYIKVVKKIVAKDFIKWKNKKSTNISDLKDINERNARKEYINHGQKNPF